MSKIRNTGISKHQTLKRQLNTLIENMFHNMCLRLLLFRPVVFVVYHKTSKNVLQQCTLGKLISYHIDAPQTVHSNIILIIKRMMNADVYTYHFVFFPLLLGSFFATQGGVRQCSCHSQDGAHLVDTSNYNAFAI